MFDDFFGSALCEFFAVGGEEDDLAAVEFADVLDRVVDWLRCH